MQWVRLGLIHLTVIELTDEIIGKVGMSVLVKGLAMDFVRQGHSEMAATSIWPASVCD